MEPHTPPRSLVGFRRSVRASYKTLNRQRCTVSPKQGLTNKCRREGLGHLLLAAHGKYSFRPARRGVAVSRWAADLHTSVTSSGSRGYDGSPGRQHPNHGP
jgi:hypothetical protein